MYDLCSLEIGEQLIAFGTPHVTMTRERSIVTDSIVNPRQLKHTWGRVALLGVAFVWAFPLEKSWICLLSMRGWPGERGLRQNIP